MCQNCEKICRLLWRQIFHSFVTVPPAGALTSPAPPCVGLPPAHSAHTEQRRKAFISRASGAPRQLPWSPSGDTNSSPACSHRTTPQGVHKPRKRRTSPLPWSPSGDTYSRESDATGAHEAFGRAGRRFDFYFTVLFFLILPVSKASIAAIMIAPITFKAETVSPSGVSCCCFFSLIPETSCSI